MKVVLSFIQSTQGEESDGVNSTTVSSQDGIEDLYDLSDFLTKAVQGAGWGYVNNVGFEQNDGQVIFGDSS